MRGAALACAALALSAGAIAAASDAPPPPAGQTVVVMVPATKLHEAVAGWRAARRQVTALRATLRRGPDFRVSLQLAGIAYGQSWRALERCALSEGARRSERYRRRNLRPNATGSGAFSSFQFMRSTFLSTPFAGLDWTRQDVQAMASAWMWAHHRRNEWAGAGC